MTNPTQEKIKILFSQAHDEQLKIAENTEDDEQFSSLVQLLTDLGYDLSSTNEKLTPDKLADTHILVVGGPREDFDDNEINAIKDFVTAGGGLLLISNAETMFNPPKNLNKLAAIANVEFQEYHNYPLTYLQIFSPHYITASVEEIQVGKIASLIIGKGARLLATTNATKQPVMSCAKIGEGRVIAIADIDWLKDFFISIETNEETYRSHQQLITNIFDWLAASNLIEIEKVSIPQTVNFGEQATVVLTLRNNNPKIRPTVECILDSNTDASISDSKKEMYYIPPNSPIRAQWTVQPKILGEQKLRLILDIEGNKQLFFDKLPDMLCQAPGYFTLEIIKEDKKTEKLKTTFQTGEDFVVAGAFHWRAGVQTIPYQLDLQLDEGLIERRHEPKHNGERWYVKAARPGSHQITLRLAETGQSQPTVVTVKRSPSNKVAEIRATYVLPLEAEITERLKQVDQSLAAPQILQQPFEILSPENFVEAVYKDKATERLWLQEVLKSAHREQWQNFGLLGLILTYIAPTYLPNDGSFIPYEPTLASHLIKLHPGHNRYIEHNLLASEESDEIHLKQHIAAFLLHEKFGHGFFYTQTRLGQQLAMLQRYNYPEQYREVVQLIKDSAIIVNEGFAAWLELTFLKTLDREVRQVVDLRWIRLIQDGTGLYEREQNSKFFQEFPPRFDSRYRESFEFLDFIRRTFNPRCAIRIYLIATNIELGITQKTQSELQFDFEVEEMKHHLLQEEIPHWRSQHRLNLIAEMLLEDDDKLKIKVRQRYCPFDCHKISCPLEAFITEKSPWRMYE